MDALKAKIRHVPDFPKAGILFYDVTTLLRDPEGFRSRSTPGGAVHGPRHRPGRRHREPRLHPRRGGRRSTRRRLRAGAQGRQAAVARPSASATTSSTAPTASRCTTTRSQPGQRVLIVDDLLATGGTARATVDLVKQLGGDVEGVAFLIELADLNGRAKLAGRAAVRAAAILVTRYGTSRARSSAG